MKPGKSTVIVVLLAFLLAAFAIAMGQGTTGGTQDPKKAESCCAEGAKCCAEGSCKHDANANSCCKEGAECCKDGAECCKKDGEKDHADCCGESCELGGKHDAGKHGAKKPGECCNVKNKGGKTKTKTD